MRTPSGVENRVLNDSTRSTPGSRTTFTRVTKWIAGCSLALGVLELAARETYRFRTFAEPDYVPVNTGTIVWSWEGHGVSHWGPHRVRAGATDVPGLPRVVVLGDSMTESLQVGDGEVFTKLVVSRLRRPANVWNAGRSSLSLADYVQYAPRHLSVLKPDWTVVVTQESDFTTDAWAAEKNHFAMTAHGLKVETVPVETFADRVQRRLAEFAALPSYVVFRARLLRASFAHEPPLFRAASEKPPAQSPSSETDRIEEEVEWLAKAYDRRITIVFLPSFRARRPHVVESEVERRVREACAVSKIGFASAGDEFERLGQQMKAPYGFENRFFADGHLNRDGHAAVAQALAETINLLELGPTLRRPESEVRGHVPKPR